MDSNKMSILLSAIVGLGLAAIPSFGQQPQYKSDQISVLVTKNMCCAHESVPAVKEISKVRGVARVVADHKSRSLTIIAKEESMPSPIAIWEAAQRAKLQVVKLQTAQGVYSAKPKLVR
jgi:hypothetical protein